MSIAMSLLALLDEGPTYGLDLRNEFEARTGGVWPLNVGQVYTTLARLERDGLVRQLPHNGDVQKRYEITGDGRTRLGEWFASPCETEQPSRDELVVKLVMAAWRGGRDGTRVIDAERRSAVETLQRYTALKREAPRDGDVGWPFLLDSLIFQAEARVRWLDACEARLRAAGVPPGRRRVAATLPTDAEVRT
ncbi:MAG TPA: PadR family transcriptional regulator [Actinomycetota bacterium]|nr:PadR family transcriptional regulator [Actinomycetota bacterium]